MNPIRCKTSLAGSFWAGLAILLYAALPAQAQFVPGPGYYPDMGVVGSVTAAYTSAAQQNAYMQNRQMQMTSSMAKSLAWQNINRSMQTQAASQTATVSDSGQAARDWMFQHSAPSRPARRPMTLPATEMAAVVPAQESAKPAVQKEIMIWPTLLKDQRFEGDRTDVEVPFRRAYADGKPLMVADYQGIIKAVENMKASVKSMESQLVETEYNSVQKYLDDLIADAQKRIQAREGAEKKE
ncbi:MAG: hypothetical protein ABSA16_04010 [Thermoguttaceae bacterium]|jgi:hypothetical protein